MGILVATKTMLNHAAWSKARLISTYWKKVWALYKMRMWYKIRSVSIKYLAHDWAFEHDINLSRLALALVPPTDQTNRTNTIVWTKAEMLTLSDPPQPYAASALDLKGLSQSRACQWASPASFVLIQRHPIFLFFSFSSQEWPQQMWPDSWWKKIAQVFTSKEKKPQEIFPN